MFYCKEISRLYTQAFYPEQLPFQGFVTTKEENVEEEMVAVQLTSESSLLPWPLKIIDYAFHFFAYLRGINHELPTHLPKALLEGKRVNEPITYNWHNRVFELRKVGINDPKVIPLRGSLYIVNNRGDYGYLGTDQTYQLKAHLRLSDGSQYLGDDKDILCKVKSDIISLPQHLPVSLFEGKKEGERIFFYYKDQPIELTLSQLKHSEQNVASRFENFLRDLKQNFASKKECLFLRDIPVASSDDASNQQLNYYKFKDFLFSTDCPEDGIISIENLSKEATVWDYTQNNFTPISEQDISFYKDILSKSKHPRFIRQDINSLTYEWSGMENKKDVKVLIDGQRIIIIGIPTRHLSAHRIISQLGPIHKTNIENLLPIEYYGLELKLNTEAQADLTKTTWEVKDNYLKLKFFKSTSAAGQ